jgi:hypothetical protein
VTEVEVVTGRVATVKLWLLAPAAIVTLGGTEATLALLLASVTAAPQAAPAHRA